METIGPDVQNDPFSRLKSLVVGKSPILPIFVYYSAWIFGDSEFKRNFFSKFLWTSINTLSMEIVGPEGQNDPFSSSYEP